MKILVVGPAWIGDMVMAHGLYQLLKEKHPGCQIDVIAPEWCHDVLLRMPEVTQAILTTFKHGKLELWTRIKLALKLRAEKYDQAILIPNSIKAALIPWIAGIPKRTGWLGEHRYGLLNHIKHLDTKQYPRQVEHFLALGIGADEALDYTQYYPRLQPQQKNTPALLEKYGLHCDKPIVLLSPGAANGKGKQWPPEYFAKFINLLPPEKYSLWLIGSKKEQPLVQRIQQGTTHSTYDLTETTLPEAIDLMSLTTVVIANDSGLMHIGAALDKHVIAIYGRTQAEFAPPLCKHHRTLSLTLDCKPCNLGKCPFGHYHCLKHITPEMVLAQFNELTVEADICHESLTY